MEPRAKRARVHFFPAKGGIIVPRGRKKKRKKGKTSQAFVIRRGQF